MKRPVIAIAGLTACSGCQLTLFNCEAELPEIAESFDIAYFPMGITERSVTGPIYVAFVEGAVSSPEDLEVLIKLRSTENYLRDRQDHVMINFGGSVGNASKYLNGPGGASGDGYPMTAPGKVVRLHVWDGTALHTSANAAVINSGDRLRKCSTNIASESSARHRSKTWSSSPERRAAPAT